MNQSSSNIADMYLESNQSTLISQLLLNNNQTNITILAFNITVIFNSTNSTNVYIVDTVVPSFPGGKINFGKNYQITAQDTAYISMPWKIVINYSDSKITSLGIDESSLALYYFNTTCLPLTLLRFNVSTYFASMYLGL